MSSPGESNEDDEQDLGPRLRDATETLERVINDRDLLNALSDDERARLFVTVGEFLHPNPDDRRRQAKERRKRRRKKKIKVDEVTLNQTGIRQLRDKPVFTTPNVFPPKGHQQIEVEDDPDFRELIEPQHCYICKQDYSKVHHFYDQLCPACAEFNYAKRSETADLSGRVALLTGGRVKIGYQAGIKLLRAGASLIVTTRFPRDAAARFAAEADSEDWADRLEIFGLDLRHTPSVEAFCGHLMNTRERLDFIVSNACQTVRRPPDFYRHMMDRETVSLAELPKEASRFLGEWEGLRGYSMIPEGDQRQALATDTPSPIAGLTHAAQLSQTALLPEEREARSHLFPEGRLDQDLQQVDLRDRNSWRLMLAEVSSVELLETQLVNAVAPFLLNARLKPLMLQTPGREKHIVNVSAVEGQFYRKFKTTRHPHTNMAKAALNMMTRTSAAEYHADGIHMNSVDTGWVSDEDPQHIAEMKTEEHRFHPPLDIVDGAARIVDPIIDGVNSGNHAWGKFFKDYRPTDW